ncbi:MAG: GrrA/OscA1 family cyclophane-containing rSAM-modified RiPP [Microcystaceae cyanobacterium]
MKITTTTGLVGFLLALSALNPPAATTQVAPSPESTVSSTIEERLTKLTAALRQRENQLQDASDSILFSPDALDVAGFSNFSNSRSRRRNRDWGNWRDGWRDGGRSNRWGDGRRWGDWRDGWRDGGGFLNLRL